MRLIDIDKVNPNDILIFSDGPMTQEQFNCAVKSLLYGQPAIDPESLRERGQWIGQEDTRSDAYYTCSNCNDYFYMECSPADNEYKYCPNCGAKMDLEVQE